MVDTLHSMLQTPLGRGERLLILKDESKAGFMLAGVHSQPAQHSPPTYLTDLFDDALDKLCILGHGSTLTEEIFPILKHIGLYTYTLITKYPDQRGIVISDATRAILDDQIGIER